jgi:sugar lactone lactonase YvrE
MKASGFRDVEIAFTCADRLGENPIWDSDRGCLVWIDIRSGIIREWTPCSATVHEQGFEGLVGGIALTNRGDWLVATRKEIGLLSRQSGTFRPCVAIELDQPDNRFNEARCDAQGRLWIGTMNDLVRQPDGALYRVGPDLEPEVQLPHVTVPNSLAWSPDGRGMYFADTWRHQILAYDFDASEGRASNPRIFVDLSAEGGRPDGSAVDAEGYLWNVQTGAGLVVRYDPHGRVDRRIPMPTRDVTACCFGGDGLETLFVTSATQKLTPEMLAAQPHAGHVFAVAARVRGLPEPRFRMAPEDCSSGAL